MYELTFLLNDEAELPVLSKLIASLDGKITNEKKWGKRELTYPIKKATAADFYTWRLTMAEPKLADLRKKLNYNDKLIRFLLLKVEDEPETKPAAKQVEE